MCLAVNTQEFRYKTVDANMSLSITYFASIKIPCTELS